MSIQLDVSTLTLQDALDAAVLIEKEAEERYLLFAEQLGRHYSGDAADFFMMMAQNERKHGMELAGIRREFFGNAPSRITAVMLKPDIEAPDYEKLVSYMSPQHALEVALESEIKAYEFYDQMLRGISEPSVRSLVLGLRDEEAMHQKMLRRMKAQYPATLEPDFMPGIEEIAPL
jgi:rubrerythrin